MPTGSRRTTSREAKSAGSSSATNLSEEHPQGDQRGEDPVQPVADRGQRLRDDPLGEDVGERQAAVLEDTDGGGSSPADGTSRGGTAASEWLRACEGQAQLHPGNPGCLSCCSPVGCGVVS